MKQFIVVNEPLFLAKGEVLRLNEDQASRRNGLIKPLGNDTYELLVDMHFKVGEVIGYRGELPKRFTSLVLETELEVGTYNPEEILADETEEDLDGFLDQDDTFINRDGEVCTLSQDAEGLTKIDCAPASESVEKSNQEAAALSSLAPALPASVQLTAKQVGEQLGIKAFPSLKALLKKIGIDIQNNDSLVPVDAVVRARAELAKPQ